MEQAAEATGVSNMELCNLERELVRNPQWVTIVKLVRFFGNPSDLLGVKTITINGVASLGRDRRRSALLVM